MFLLVLFIREMHLFDLFIWNDIFEDSLGKIKPWNNHNSNQISPEIFVKCEMTQVQIKVVTILNNETISNNNPNDINPEQLSLPSSLLIADEIKSKKAVAI